MTMNGTRSTPWLIILLGIAFLVLTAWSIYLAARGASAVTDTDYYSHGLRYNQTMLEQKTAASLGWEVTAALQGRVLTIQLHDRERQIVAGALGTLTVLGPGKQSAREFPFHEIESGIYRVEFSADIRGEQSAEIAFSRDGARLSKRLLLALK